MAGHRRQPRVPGVRHGLIADDHGCDPAFTETTDHTREYVPWLIAGTPVHHGVNLGTFIGLDAIAANVCEALGTEARFVVDFVWEKLKNECCARLFGENGEPRPVFTAKNTSAQFVENDKEKIFL